MLSQEFSEELKNSFHRVSEDILSWFVATSKDGSRRRDPDLLFQAPDRQSTTLGFISHRESFLGSSIYFK